jgi:thiol-disulfide isomerase/thioredoxin
MRKRVNYSVLFLVSLLFCSPFLGKASTRSVAEGEDNGWTEGYDLSFRDSKNNVLSLNQLKGKVVVINLWATWCPPCLAEMPSLDQLYQDFKSNDRIIILSVDIDGNLSTSRKFMAKRKYGLPVYQLNSALPNELSTTSIPTTIILDKAGKLVIKHVGGMNFGSQKFRKSLLDLSKE